MTLSMVNTWLLVAGDTNEKNPAGTFGIVEGILPHDASPERKTEVYGRFPKDFRSFSYVNEPMGNA